MKRNIIIILTLILCKSTNIFAFDVKTDKFTYRANDTISFSVECNTPNLKIQLRDLSIKGEPIIVEIEIKQQWVVPADVPCHAIGIYLKDEETGQSTYSSYFRIVDDTMITTYEIEKMQHKGLDIFTLNGGMSAEYAVQKSLSDLCGAISHTWKIGPGGGPNPVWGTPDFLVSSIKETISLYNENLGEHTPIETVIISTGIPVIPYLSATLDAVVLPLHFLASVNSIKEIESILNYSGINGYPSYATLGYDASMDDVGVAWVKMLDLPKEYIEFINNHQVKNVIIAGIGQEVYSESFCRKLKKSGKQNEEYANGSLYILYTQSGSAFDINSLSSHLRDYDENKLEEGKFLADWESGIIDSQIETFSETINKNTKAKPYSLIASSDMAHMYNLAVDLSLAYLKKNNIEVDGVVLNEYLISHPKYELSKGRLPLLYWQFTPASTTINTLDNYITTATANCFPKIRLKEKNIHINARIGKYDLENELKSRSYSNTTKRLDNVEEIWDMTDGINAPCEFIVHDILCSEVTAYKEHIRTHASLTIGDLDNLMKQVPEIILKSK